MCHFEYTFHGCGHKGLAKAVICQHMGKKVKPKVDFTTMSFVKMATCVRVCTQYWGEKDTRVYKEDDTICDECALKEVQVQVQEHNSSVPS